MTETSTAVAAVIGALLFGAKALCVAAVAFASVVAPAWAFRVVLWHVRDRRGFDTGMRERLEGMVEGAGRAER
jgi:hypothetical protein